jgi:hypothetical protein
MTRKIIRLIDDKGKQLSYDNENCKIGYIKLEHDEINGRNFILTIDQLDNLLTDFFDDNLEYYNDSKSASIRGINVTKEEKDMIISSQKLRDEITEDIFEKAHNESVKIQEDLDKYWEWIVTGNFRNGYPSPAFNSDVFKIKSKCELSRKHIREDVNVFNKI